MGDEKGIHKLPFYNTHRKYKKDKILVTGSYGSKQQSAKRKNSITAENCKVIHTVSQKDQKGQKDQKERSLSVKKQPNAIIPMVDVLLQDPASIDEFRKDGNVVYISMSVINHLNELKNKPGLYEDAVEVGRRIEEASKKRDGSLIIYQEIDRDIMSKIGLNENNPQHQSISSAHRIYRENKEIYHKVKLISLDAFNRIIASRLAEKGMVIEDYLREHISIVGKKKDVLAINVAAQEIQTDAVSQSRFIDYNAEKHGSILENDGVICYKQLSHGSEAISVFPDLGDKFCAVKKDKKLIILDKQQKLFGLSPSSSDYIDKDASGESYNHEQAIAIYKLKNPRYLCHFLQGGPGCGKTLFALAGGLHHINLNKENGPRRILFICPMVHVNDEDNMGFLPGDMEKKLSPWIKPATDNLEVLERFNQDLADPTDKIGNGKNKHKKNRQNTEQSALGMQKNWLYNKLKKEGKIAFEPIDYLRGRTISHTYIIVDDAQNLTRHQIKTIITRAGKGSILVFTGDLQQTDRVINLYGITRVLNGFAYGIQKLSGQSEVSVIIFNRSVRSQLAHLGDKFL